ncbi:hypothetical protein KUCAC02_021163 [Chaenocephalus aceratus]|uniref:Uncharacterized protein n=1 Tax=Chaenocephalus aceratus TaxID=36190 RepID=A0ACB9XEL8_CHAAC|nr:hypothetical protein KUCAC02_021163 [Chaenocephalus aceratus]
MSPPDSEGKCQCQHCDGIIDSTVLEKRQVVAVTGVGTMMALPSRKRMLALPSLWPPSRQRTCCCSGTLRPDKPLISPTMTKNIVGHVIYQLTVIFTLIYHGEIFHIASGRKRPPRNVFKGIFKNTNFCVSFLGTLLAQILIVQFGGSFYSCVALNWQQWLVCGCLGLGSLLWGQHVLIQATMCSFMCYITSSMKPRLHTAVLWLLTQRYPGGVAPPSPAPSIPVSPVMLS